MNTTEIIEIEKLDHVQAEQLQQLFSALYKHMDDCGLMLPLISNGQVVWVDATQKTIKHFGKLVVAKENDRLIGFGHGVVKLTPDYIGGQKVGAINHFYVSPGHRGKGIGRKIAKKLEEWFISQQVHSFELQVTYGNQSGQFFWKKMGYEPELIQLRKFPK